MNLGKETETVEFKKTTSELKEAVISLSSMLNKSGTGIVYFGVKNNGEIFGQQPGAETTSHIVNEIKFHIKPFVNPKISTIDYENLTIIKVEAFGVDTPYSAYGRYYKRCDDQDLEMIQRELEHFFNNKNITYSSWEKTVTAFDEECIDEELLIDYIDKANELNRLNYRYKSTEDALTRLNLIENGKLNNAGYYLFSKNKPLLVKFARFATDDRITFIDNRQFRGNIFECIEESYTYILSSINFNSIIKGAERVEKPEIPLEAIREIVVNSFAHMRVNDGDYNEITISPHFVRIYNPGTIAFGKDPKEFAEGIIGSKLRNPLIALTLYKNKSIEAFGTGFKRVFTLCEAEKVNYSYSNEGLGFSFIFQRNTTSLLREKESSGNAPLIPSINAEVELTGSTAEIYNYMLVNTVVANAENLAKELGKSTITIQRGFKQLINLGLVKRIGSNKTGYWKVV